MLGRSILLLVVLFVPPTAKAQSDEDLAAQFLNDVTRFSRTFSPAAASNIQPAGDMVRLLTAETGKAEVSLLLTRKLSSSFEAHAKFSAPLDKDNPDRTALATLKGLADAPSLELGLNWTNQPSTATVVTALRAAAQPVSEGTLGSSNRLDPVAILAAAASAQSDRTAAFRSRDAIVTPALIAEAFRIALETEKQSSLTYNFASFTLGASEKGYKYAAADGAKQVARRTGLKLAASAGRFEAKRWYYGAGVRFQQTYKDGDPLQFCSPVTGSVGQKCTSLPPTPPTRKNERVLSVEARINSHGGSFGVNPSAYFNWVRNPRRVYGVDVPFYVIPNIKSTDPANGGIAFGWDNKDHFVVSVFVGMMRKIGVPWGS